MDWAEAQHGLKAAVETNGGAMQVVPLPIIGSRVNKSLSRAMTFDALPTYQAVIDFLDTKSVASLLSGALGVAITAAFKSKSAKRITISAGPVKVELQGIDDLPGAIQAFREAAQSVRRKD